MNVQMFLLNTYGYQGHQHWHTTSMSSLLNYCDRHNIKFNYINENDYRIQKLLSKNHQFFPFMRKMIRYYEMVKSGADYAIMIDLDTLVLNMNKDIRDYIHPEQEYINGEAHHVNSLKSSNPMHQGWINCILAASEIMIGRPMEYVWKCDSGFSVFSRDFCEKFVTLLADNDLDITSDSGIDNLSQIDKEVIAKTGHSIHDEHLLSYFMTKDENYKNIKISYAYGYLTYMCSSHYHVTQKYSGVNEPDEYGQNLYQIACHDCIFHHLIMSKEKVATYTRMFKK